MKRPFACIGFSMLFSLVFSIAFHTAVFQSAVVCFVLSIVFIAVKVIGKKNTVSAAVCCISACVAMFGYLGVIKYYVEPIINEYSGKTAEFSGTVISSSCTNDNTTSFTVKTDTINGEKRSVKISITSSNTLPIGIYDFVNIRAPLYSDYESGYGYASYYGARDIFLSAYINTYYGSECLVTQNTHKPFYVIFNNMRNYIANIFQKYLSYNESSLCTAIITGDKEYLKDDVYLAFKNLGISHILVVSGLHLSIVASLIYILTSNAFRNKYISALLQIFAITAFAALSGFGFSVRRAFIMALVMIIARFFSVKADALNTLGLAAFLMCLNPLNVGDIGLLWSFSCTLSIILLSNKLTDSLIEKLEIKRGIYLKLTAIFSTSASAFVGSIPFLIFVTGSISPYTILVNMLTVPFTGIVILCGGFAVLFFALNINFLAYPTMYISGMTAKYLIYVTDTFQSMPYSGFKTDKTFVYIWFAITVAVLAMIIIFDKRKIYLKLGVIASVTVIIGLYSVDAVFSSSEITFSVLDVGNGMTLTVKNDDKIIVLNSYGEKYQYYTIKNELSDFVNISCLIDVPPYKTDYNYCRKITHDFMTDKIIVYNDTTYIDKYSYLKYIGTDVEKISNSYTLYIFDGVTLDIVTTEKNTWEYLTVYGTEILICPLYADFSELPERFKRPNISVVCDLPNNFNFDDDVYVVVSAYGNECTNIVNILENMGITVEATNGNGKIDFTFSENGAIDVKREYTGGVTRYADNQ